VIDCLGAAGHNQFRAQRWRRIDHVRCLAEDDTGLLSVHGGGIDLGTGLAIRAESVETESRGECAFEVLLRHPDVGGAVAPASVRAHPGEEGHHDRVTLYRRELESLA